MGRNQYVWPAIGSDGGSNNPGPAGGLYRGVDRNFAPGSLVRLFDRFSTDSEMIMFVFCLTRQLAIPPADAEKLKTTTAVGAKIKQALVE